MISRSTVYPRSSTFRGSHPLGNAVHSIFTAIQRGIPTNDGAFHNDFNLDLTGRFRWSPSSPPGLSFSPGSFGRAPTTDGNDNFQAPESEFPGALSDFTAAAIFNVIDTSTFSSIINRRGGSGDNMTIHHSDAVDEYSAFITGNITIPLNDDEWHIVFIRRRGDVLDIVGDNNREVNLGNTQSANAVEGSMRIFGQPTGGNALPSGSSVLFSIVWPYALPLSEMSKFARDPWALIRNPFIKRMQNPYAHAFG